MPIVDLYSKRHCLSPQQELKINLFSLLFYLSIILSLHLKYNTSMILQRTYDNSLAIYLKKRKPSEIIEDRAVFLYYI